MESELPSLACLTPPTSGMFNWAKKPCGLGLEQRCVPKALCEANRNADVLTPGLNIKVFLQN